MTEDFGDDLVLEDHADKPHFSATAGTFQRVNFVHPSDKTCPCSSPRPPLSVGEPVILLVSRVPWRQGFIFPFLPTAARDITVVPHVVLM